MEDLGSSVPAIVKELARSLPKFADGRIDYSQAGTAPVILCFVQWQDKILLLKRGDRVLSYKNKWNTVGGYLDEIKPLADQAYQELREEIGVTKETVANLMFLEPRTFTDQHEGKTWIIHPVLAVLREQPKIVLDWEHTEYRWIRPEEITIFDIVPNVDRNLFALLEKKKLSHDD